MLLVKFLPEKVLAICLKLKAVRRKSAVSVKLKIPNLFVSKLKLETYIISLKLNQKCVTVLIACDYEIISHFLDVILIWNIYILMMPFFIFKFEENASISLIFKK